MTMTKQLTFDLDAGRRLRDEGAQRASDHADKVTENWSEKAWAFFTRFLRTNDDFLMEDVRAAAEGIVPDPPDKRAWGGIALRAAKSGLIYRSGYRPMKSKNCHANPKSVWRKTNTA